MKYFDYLKEADQEALFFRRPEPFSKTTEREVLRGGLGGLLYTPGSSRTIASMLLTRKVRGLTALSICLEDSVGDLERVEAVENVGQQLSQVRDGLERGLLTPDSPPLIFIRVKSVSMLEEMADLLVRHSPVLTGVILPKVTADSLAAGLALTEEIHRQCKDPFYAMPILESAELMTSGDRLGLLRALRDQTDRFFDRVLNIRVGATDLSGVLGIRRRRDTTVYQVGAVAGCISDVIRVFGPEDRYTISGPVWEYFRPVEQAMESGQWAEIEGLLREVSLDQQNGFCGKTCAHPAQLLPVQAAYGVPWEAWQDASAILEGDQDWKGVLSSAEKNKMNELKPHALWARRVLRQARFFGVYRPEIGIPNLFRTACKGGAA